MIDVLTFEKKYFLSTYNRIQKHIIRGEGIYLIDSNGDRYMDFFSGLGVNALGYSHPKIIEAVYNQISSFAHLSNYFITDIQIRFAQKLLAISKMDKLFLTNSGTETTEAALKLIRKIYGPDKIMFSLTNSFHGRTYGSLSLTARTKYRNGYEPFVPHLGTIEFNNSSDLTKKVNSNTAAIFIEFIQGEGGINEVSTEFINELISLKSKFDFIIVADEIQSGIGRTGKPFSHNFYKIEPDIILTAKAIGGGLPLGALLVNDKLTNVFSTGDHGTTFGGNPVSCAADLIVLQEVFENRLIEQVSELGSYFKDQLIKLQKSSPEIIKEVRGKGFMLGVGLNFPGKKVVDQMLKTKILINCTNTNIIRLLPPLITTKEQIDYFLNNFEEVLLQITQG